MTARRFLTCTAATLMVVAASASVTLIFWRTVCIGTLRSIRLIWRTPSI